jgi:glyoxylase-like metal-dependent hydrolase (beta-lactamase superfamily II)
MIEEVASNIYRIVVPLPVPVIGSMNSYVITDPGRNLIVDPGMAHTLCREAMQTSLEDLGLDLERTDFFMTHHHADHFGLVSQFMTEKSVIYINDEEAAAIGRIASHANADIVHFARMMGFSDTTSQGIASVMSGDECRAREAWPFRYVKEGETIERGGYSFRCMITPGHSSAHTCLYEQDRKILIAGDSISPVLQFLSDRANPLLDHMNSLNRLYQLDIKLVLPGHRSIFRDGKRRIGRLKAHHNEKVEAVLSTLSDCSRNSYQVAASMQRAIGDSVSWETLPLLEKFFLTRDCFAHLRYLGTKGLLQEAVQEQGIIYSPRE